MKKRSNRVLRLIAIFRFAKALLLIASGLVAVHLISAGTFGRATAWVQQMPFATQHAFVQRAISTVTRMPPKRVEEFAIGFFLYAALFTVEGTGLWLGKVWAEWLTVVATTSFIPFEIYEVMHKPTPVRIAILVLNIAIVIYLLWLRTTERRRP
jgi:uncharacterized membrane protein (DUF2068 family)